MKRRLTYPSGKEVAVISVFSDNVRYEVVKDRTIIDHISPGNKKQIVSKTYAGRELISILGGMVAFNHFVNDDRVIKTNKLRGITEMILNLDELDNTDNLEDRRLSSALLTYHVTVFKISRSSRLTHPSTRDLKTKSLVP